MDKKEWIKPQLIQMERGQPQEFVLTHCKREAAGTGPNMNSYHGCSEYNNCDSSQSDNGCQSRGGGDS